MVSRPGKVKTAGRGTKGQNSRTGGGVRPGFEGGQNPWAKRIPKKRGFTPRTHTEYQVINLSDLADFKAGTTVDIVTLRNAGRIGSVRKPVKLLARGEVSTKLTIELQGRQRHRQGGHRAGRRQRHHRSATQAGSHRGRRLKP